MPAKDRLKHLMSMRAEKQIARSTPGLDMSDNLKKQIAEEVESSFAHREHVSKAAGRVSRASKTPTPTMSPAFLSPAREEKSPKPPGLNQKLKKAATPLIPVVCEEPQKDLWADIAKQSYQEQLEQQTKERMARAEKIRQQKEYLDEMVSIRQRVKKENSKVSVVERAAVDKLKVVWDQEQKNMEKTHREIADSIRRDREEQVADRKRRRQIEQEEKKRTDEAILKRIEVEVEEQKQRVQREKERQMKMKEELIAENEVQKKIKQKQKEHEAELEAACIKEMELRLEKQARERQRAWNAMKEKMKGREAMALELQATLDEVAAEDEKKGEAITAQRWKEREEREKAEEEKRKKGLLKVLEFQYKQIEERNHQMELEKEAKEREKEEAEILVKDSLKAIELKKKEARDKIAAQQAMLIDQIRDNQRYQSVVISDEEKALNRQILDAAHGVQSPSRFKRLMSPF